MFIGSKYWIIIILVKGKVKSKAFKIWSPDFYFDSELDLLFISWRTWHNNLRLLACLCYTDYCCTHVWLLGTLPEYLSFTLPLCLLCVSSVLFILSAQCLTWLAAIWCNTKSIRLNPGVTPPFPCRPYKHVWKCLFVNLARSDFFSFLQISLIFSLNINQRFILSIVLWIVT